MTDASQEEWKVVPKEKKQRRNEKELKSVDESADESADDDDQHRDKHGDTKMKEEDNKYNRGS
jgi:hypothetical protein